MLKVGRTQLQDAVPMTLGQEFSAYAVMLGEDEQRLAEAASLIREINLGATAIGTGINAHPDYAALVTQRLSEVSGIAFIVSPNLIEATQDAGAFVQLSGVLKRVAVKLSKICNDLRLLSSGPRAGIGEITLPAVQAGSSIMPGKVNPVIPEVVNQIAFEVIGNDITVTMAAEAGQLQLNAFEPIIAHSLFKSLAHLAAGCRTLAERCVKGITANRERARRLLDESTALVTALNPFIGYARSSEIAQEALRTERPRLRPGARQGLHDARAARRDPQARSAHQAALLDRAQAAERVMRYLAVFLVFFTWISETQAQPYPAKPVRIICAFPVGGIADLYGRIIAAKLAESWGQPIVVDNRAGAGGTIAAEAVAKSPPDGYNLVMGSVGTHAVNVSLFSKLPYDAVKDFSAGRAAYSRPRGCWSCIHRFRRRTSPSSSRLRRRSRSPSPPPAWAPPATSRASCSRRWPRST